MTDSNEPAYVWYACYGSNLNRERFMEYIRNCPDKTEPVEARPFTLPHPIYFAKSGKRWDNGAVAFLDDSRDGAAYSRIYKITSAQYESVKQQEGASYTKKLSFGTVDGLPVYSFTDTQRNEPLRVPARSYFSVILRGLRECYGGILSAEETARYLIGAALPEENAFAAARALYEHGHTDADAALSWLLERGVVQRTESAYSLAEGPCGTDLIAAMIEALESEN